ncbi:MAG: cell division protein ZapA [Streptococcaceae bacterium]|nr:cell division protein ZapA [Streptococcaceae bacterium]
MIVVERNRYKTEIAGNTYTIIGTESKTHMDMVSRLVDEQLTTIKNLAQGTTNEQAAILTALNAMSDQLKKQERLLSLEKEVEELRVIAKRVEDVEKRLSQVEQIEREANEIMAKKGYGKVQNHIEARQIINQTSKEKIQRSRMKK